MIWRDDKPDLPAMFTRSIVGQLTAALICGKPPRTREDAANMAARAQSAVTDEVRAMVDRVIAARGSGLSVPQWAATDDDRNLHTGDDLSGLVSAWSAELARHAEAFVDGLPEAAPVPLTPVNVADYHADEDGAPEPAAPTDQQDDLAADESEVIDEALTYGEPQAD